MFFLDPLYLFRICDVSKRRTATRFFLDALGHGGVIEVHVVFIVLVLDILRARHNAFSKFDFGAESITETAHWDVALD